MSRVRRSGSAQQGSANQLLYLEFYDFCRKGDAGQAQRCLTDGLRADWINEKDRRRSLLMATAWKDSHEVCALLIKHNAPLNHQDASGLTALHICAKQNSIRVAEILLSARADVNLTDQNDVTALMICADLGHNELASLMLNRPDINLDQQSRRGFTALMKSVFQNSREIAGRLIDRGARLDLTSQSGFNALHLCAQLDRRHEAGRILDKADRGLIHRTTFDESKANTAFALAALNGNVEMMRLLRDRGANVRHRNSDGHTVLDQVKRQSGCAAGLEVQKLLEQWEREEPQQQGAAARPSLSDAICANDVDLIRSLVREAPLKCAEKAASPKKSTGRTPLMLASGLDRPELLKLLLEAIRSSRGDAALKEAVNAKSADSEKATALHDAVSCGSEKCTRWLLNAGASVKEQNARGETPLDLVACQGCPPQLAELLFSQLTQFANADQLALSLAKKAAEAGHQEVLRPMLKLMAQAGLLLRNRDWLAQIRTAALKARRHEAAKVALEFMPADSQLTEEQAISKLFNAAMERNKAQVKILLDNQQLDVINKRCPLDPGWTALMVAAWNDDMDTCQLLIERGADPNVTATKLGVTALHIAVQQDSIRVAKVLASLSNIDLNAKSKDKRTALIRAAWLNRLDIAKLLLTNTKVSVNEQEVDGFSALHFCAQENFLELAKLLINHGADLELQSKNCHTAFTLAAFKGYEDMLELLANVGAKVYHRSTIGDAMELARRTGRVEVIKVLKTIDAQQKNAWASPPEMQQKGHSRHATSEQAAFQSDAGSFRRPSKVQGGTSSEQDSQNLNSTIVPPICGYQYSMRSNPRGICVIVNNEDFDKDSKRLGSQKDVQKLQRLFGDQLKFRVQVHQNLDAGDMLAVMRSLAESNRHSKFDCFVAFIMSHGENERIQGSDSQPVGLDDIFSLFRGCKSLLQKPKLFFIQSCRSLPSAASQAAKFNTDEPPDESADSSRPSESVPQDFSDKMDFLFSHATTKGDKALRDTNEGSLFITTLCDVIEKHRNNFHLCAMLNMVRQKLGRRPVPVNVDSRESIFFNLPSEVTQLQGDVWFKDFATQQG